jgi:hypothetical protein
MQTIEIRCGQRNSLISSLSFFKGSSMEEKPIRIDFSAQGIAILHHAVFELQGRPSINSHEVRAIQSAEQKTLIAARLAGMDLHRW